MTGTVGTCQKKGVGHYAINPLLFLTTARAKYINFV